MIKSRGDSSALPLSPWTRCCCCCCCCCRRSSHWSRPSPSTGAIWRATCASSTNYRPSKYRSVRLGRFLSILFSFQQSSSVQCVIGLGCVSRTGLCLVQWESNYNTSAIGTLNADGSADHGLFQISDKFWCSGPGSLGEACGLTCQRTFTLTRFLSAVLRYLGYLLRLGFLFGYPELRDDDIKDDVICAKRVYRAHQKLTGNGFNAWWVRLCFLLFCFFASAPVFFLSLDLERRYNSIDARIHFDTMNNGVGPFYFYRKEQRGHIFIVALFIRHRNQVEIMMIDSSVDATTAH